MSEWKPIETAPRDGRYILVVKVGFMPSVACYKEGVWVNCEGCFDDDPESFGAWEVTHWMPMPKPPSVGEHKDKADE